MEPTKFWGMVLSWPYLGKCCTCHWRTCFASAAFELGDETNNTIWTGQRIGSGNYSTFRMVNGTISCIAVWHNQQWLPSFCNKRISICFLSWFLFSHPQSENLAILRTPPPFDQDQNWTTSMSSELWGSQTREAVGDLRLNQVLTLFHKVDTDFSFVAYFHHCPHHSCLKLHEVFSSDLWLPAEVLELCWILRHLRTWLTFLS